MLSRIRIVAAASASLALLGAAQSVGQTTAAAPAVDENNTFAEITVTAQRRQERSVDVPISITTVSGDTLAAAGVSTVTSLPESVAGLRFDFSGAYAQPTIRGVGSALAGPGMNSNIAIYIDGFYEPNLLGSDFDLASISSVDVLKGPQGTLFGRNATGGAILVTTRDPSHEFGGNVNASYASFGHQKYSGYVTGEVTHDLAADATLMYEQGDGFIRSSFTGEDVAKFKKYEVRTKWLYTPTDAQKYTLTYEHRYSADPTSNYTSNYDGLSYGSVVPGTLIASGSRDYSGTAPARNTFAGDSVMLKAAWDLNFADLTSYSMYRNERAGEAKDYDGTNLSIFAANWEVLDKTYSQELDLSSHANSALTWLVGLYYYRNVNDYPAFHESVFGSPYFSAFSSTIKQESYAAYADATYEIVNNLYFTLGVRESVDHAKGQYTDLTSATNDREGGHSWSATTPRAVLRYKLTPQSNVYASFTEGYKAGIEPITESTIPVSPEKIHAYEVGYKLATPVVHFDTSVYYYKYKDLQIASYVGTISLTRNAATTTIYGFDTSAAVNVGDHVTINASANVTHARYDSFPGAIDYQQIVDPASPANGFFINPAVDASGKTMQRAPKFSGNLGGTYHTGLLGGELALTANLYSTTKFYFDPVNRFSQGGYELLNLRAGWTAPGGKWSAEIFGTNVTNTKYRNEVLPGPFAIQQTYGEPAAVGVLGSWKF